MSEDLKNPIHPVLWVLRLLLERPILFLGIIIGIISHQSLRFVIPVLIGNLIDNGVEDGNIEKVKLIAIAILVIALLSALLDLTMSWANEIAANDVEYKTRSIYFRSIQSKTMAFHDQARLGEMMSVAQNDMRSLYSAVAPGFRLFGESIVSIIVVLLFIFIESYILGLIFLFLLPFWLFSIYQYYQRLTPAAITQQKDFRDMSSVAQENLVNAKIVRAFAQEEGEIDSFGRMNKQYTSSWEHRGKIAALFTPMLATYTLAGIMFICSVYLAITPSFEFFGMKIQQDFGVGSFVTVMGLMVQFRQPTFFVGATIELASLGFAGVEKVQSTIASGHAEIDEYQTSQQGRTIEGGVSFENVSFSYSETQVLEQINFEVNPGEVVAIVGAPGSGKTTMMKLLTRFYEVSSGTIKIDGIDIRDFDLLDLRKAIGTVEQDIHLFSTTIIENIAYALDENVAFSEIDRVCKLARVDEFIDEMPDGYSTITGERGERLSGGQRQRIAIARALLTDPKILVLDDSTSAVDGKTEHEIVSALNELMKGRTSFLITNRLNMMREADRILVVNNGIIVSEGKHKDLIGKDPIYTRIFSPYMNTNTMEGSD
ncbi:MAG: ABC transporter ATP-binding protein [Candidatus Kariarchaeaceae archaeon]|jgi:ATP-binding cassette subfamily B protein